jgi:hypothetical protein
VAWLAASFSENLTIMGVPTSHTFFTTDGVEPSRDPESRDSVQASPDASVAPSSVPEGFPEQESADALTPADRQGVDHPLDELVFDPPDPPISVERAGDTLVATEELESLEDMRFDPSEFNDFPNASEETSLAETVEIPDIWMLDPSYFNDSPEPQDDSRTEESLNTEPERVSLGVGLDDLVFEEVPFGDFEYFEPSVQDGEALSEQPERTDVQSESSEAEPVSPGAFAPDGLAEPLREVPVGMKSFEKETDNLESKAEPETDATRNFLWDSSLDTFVDLQRLSGFVRKSLAALGIFIIILVAVAAALAYFNDYKVQSDLLYLSRDIDPRIATGRSLDQEIRILTSTTLMHSFAEHVFKRAGSRGEGSEIDPGQTAFFNNVNARFGEPGRLLKWLSGAFSLTSDPAKGFLQVSVEGDDPVFLKAVLDSYVRYYAGHRDSWLSRREEQAGEATIDKQVIQKPRSTTKMANELQLINARAKEFKLALDLMKSGTGPFRGFLPSDGATGLPSLEKFQSRIVELELKKRELAVRYKAGSREIHSIEQEIAGVRRAMIDCTREHLRFLEGQGNGLLAQMQESNSSEKRNLDSSIASKPKLVEKKPIPGSPLIGEGLYLAERAHVVRRPIFAGSSAEDSSIEAGPGESPSRKISGIMNRLPLSHWFGAASKGRVDRPADSSRGRARPENGAFRLSMWKMY